MQLRKVAAGALGALMAGMSLAGAALAADYTLSDFPAPFVENGTPNFLIVVGSGGSAAGIASDIAGSLNIAARLGGETVTTEGGDTTTVVSGESVNMASGTDQIYLTDYINAQRSTITKDDLPTILADGTFVDDDGTSYDYEQSIIVDDTAQFQFGTSGGDLDDPNLILQIGDTATSSTYFYRWKIDFNKAVDFNDAASTGQKIELAGKEYTIGSSTDSDTLQLLGGAEDIYLDTESENTKTVTVSGEEYTVTLKGVTSSGEAVIQVEKDGTTDTKTISSGHTKTVNGVDVYVDTANYYGLESKLGDATVMLGADEIYLEDGSEVMVGSDKDSIEGTLVSWSTDCDSMTTISIYVAAADDDTDHVGIGDKFEDPVFGTLEFLFADAKNAPTFASPSDTNTARKTIDIQRAADRGLQVELTDSSGNQKTIEFAYQGNLKDTSSKDIHIYEGDTVSEDEYFFLNSGDYTHFMKLTKINADDDSTADDDIWFQDVFTGETYKLTDKDIGHDGDTQDITIKGQTYTVKCIGAGCATGVQIYRASGYTANTNMQVYQYLNLVSGKDHRMAFTDDISDVATDQSLDETTPGSSASNYVTLVLPTGTLYVDAYENSGGSPGDTYAYSTDGSTWTVMGSAGSPAAVSVPVGTVRYIITPDTDGTFDIAIDSEQDSDTNDAETDPGILFVEDEDNSDNDDKNAVIIPVTDDTSYTEVDDSNIVFTSPNTYEDVSFDDNDYQGNIDSYGTLVITDNSDSNQHLATLTFPTEQMYGEFYFGETGITTSGGTTGEVTRTGVIKTPISAVDTQVTETQKANENLILVGGPCVNKLTADALGLTYPACGMATVESLGIPSDGYMIKLVKNAFAEGKYALVVFGVEAKDTTAACAKVQADMADMTGTEYIYPAPLETTPEESEPEGE